MLSARDIALMRSGQEETFPDLGVIKRVSKASDGFGGRTHTGEATVASDVPCRVSQGQTQNTQGQGDRLVRLEKWTVRVPVGTDLQTGDIFEWGGIRIQLDEVKAHSWQTALTGAGEVVK